MNKNVKKVLLSDETYNVTQMRAINPTEPEYKASLAAVKAVESILSADEKEKFEKKIAEKRLELEEEKFEHQANLDEQKFELEKEKAEKADILEYEKLSFEKKKLEFEKEKFENEKAENAKKEQKELLRSIIDGIVKIAEVTLPIIAYVSLYKLNLKLVYIDNGIVDKNMSDVLRRIK